MGPSRQINTFWVNCQKKGKNCTLAFFQFFLCFIFINIYFGAYWAAVAALIDVILLYNCFGGVNTH